MHLFFTTKKPTPKMVNTRAKIKKTQNTLKTCFWQASMADSDSDHQSTQSGAIVDSNDDLLTEILRLLPVTSILLSKQWQSLLSHRCFTLLYDNLSISPGIFVRDLYVPFDAENQSPAPIPCLDFYPYLCYTRIVQSCNGLLLCFCNRGNQRAHRYFVLNPTTKQFAIIPSVPGGPIILSMVLAFHQTDCVHYKVVCIHRSSLDKEQFQIQIYSSDTGKWKISNECFTDPYYMSFSNGVYWNGAIHWAPSCLNPSYFMVNEEKLKKMPLPSPLPERVVSFGGYEDGDMPFYFGESRGHLHLVDTAHNDTYLLLNVYEMLTNHSGWSLKYQVDLDELPVAYPEMIRSHQHPSSPHFYEFDIIDFHRGDKEEDTFMVVIIPGKIIRYNLHDKSFKKIFDLPNNYNGRMGYWEVHRYIQTLTPF